MATDFIDRLRNASFPTARRGGYDPAAVDAYLGELADWLETGGDDQTRAALVQREMERVGERTGAILAAAQESADRIAAEARVEAGELRSTAEADAGETRSTADSYASEKRSSADEHVRISAEAATREAADVRVKADAEAQGKIGEADAHLQRANDEAAARTAGVEEEIVDLLRARDALLESLEELAGGINGVVEGSGKAPIDIPERVAKAHRQDLASAGGGHPAERPRSVEEHPVVAAPVEATEPHPGPDPEPASDEAETALLSTKRPPAEEEETFEDDDEETTSSQEADYDTDEQEQAREAELERRRNPTRRSNDPPTEDQSLTDLL